MTFLWPSSLYFLPLIPVLVAAYAWLLYRRSRLAVRFSSLALIRAAGLRKPGWRRHLPFGVFVAAVASLIMAGSRPTMITVIPTAQATIILAIDVSGSMCSTDIPPTRLQAAEAAAENFVRKQKPNTQIGLVAFAGFAELVQPPTTDQRSLQAAIESLLAGHRTAVGSAILKSLDAIAEVDKAVAPSIPDTAGESGSAPVPRGAYVPDIVVLLTDGSSNAGPSPLEAAQQAADRGVRVYTIGFGTDKGSEFASCQSSDPSGLGGYGGFGGFAGGFGGGGGFRRGIDEATLRKIADTTGGIFYPASSAEQLESVFQHLPTHLIAKHETSEISVIFALAGAVLAALALTLSLVWHPLS